MKIGIVGNGVVGNATAEAFHGFVDEVLIYDLLPERRKHCVSYLYYKADIIFICLPTPANNDGSCNTRMVDLFLDGTAIINNNLNLVLRSTVPIGYTRKARERFNLPNLVHSPEFLTERTAVEDAKNPTRLLIGSPLISDTGIHLNSTCDDLWQLYRKRWPWPESRCKILTMSSDESETVKLFQNALSAIKIATFNEFRSLVDKCGMDWDQVLAALLASGWINPMHTQVPGPDGKRGFGGSCLPKDTANLRQCMRDLDLLPMMCDAALIRNEEDRKDGIR